MHEVNEAYIQTIKSVLHWIWTVIFILCTENIFNIFNIALKYHEFTTDLNKCDIL